MEINKIFIKKINQKDIMSVFSSLLNFKKTIVSFSVYEIDDEIEITVERLSFNEVKELLESNKYRVFKIVSSFEKNKDILRT